MIRRAAAQNPPQRGVIRWGVSGRLVAWIALLVIAAAACGGGDRSERSDMSGVAADGNAAAIERVRSGAAVIFSAVGSANDDALIAAGRVIDRRLRALDIRAFSVERTGDSLLVIVGDGRNQGDALDIIGSTGELRFRPVLRVLPPYGARAPAEETTTAAGPGALLPGAEIETTGRDADLPDTTVVLPGRPGAEDELRYELGPAELTGKAVRTAKARFQGEWTVDVKFNAEGSRTFDELAAKYFGRQVGIVLDGVVQSAPSINAREFNGTAIISGSFNEREAKHLALLLSHGALPIRLDVLAVQSYEELAYEPSPSGQATSSRGWCVTLEVVGTPSRAVPAAQIRSIRQLIPDGEISVARLGMTVTRVCAMTDVPPTDAVASSLTDMLASALVAPRDGVSSTFVDRIRASTGS